MSATFAALDTDADRDLERMPRLSACTSAETQRARRQKEVDEQLQNLIAKQDYAGAAESLDQAIRLAEAEDSAGWNLYYQRGIAHERLKQWDKAEPDFRKALELSPNQPAVLNYLGYSWVDMNRNLEEGLDMIKKAVTLRPNDGYIIDSLGWAYYRLGRYQDAVDELERAVLITPMDPTINDHLGDAYWHVGRKREAEFQWERALNGEPAPEPEVVEAIKVKLEKGLQPETDEGGSADGKAAPAAEAADTGGPRANAAPPETGTKAD